MLQIAKIFFVGRLETQKQTFLNYVFPEPMPTPSVAKIDCLADVQNFSEWLPPDEINSSSMGQLVRHSCNSPVLVGNLQEHLPDTDHWINNFGGHGKLRLNQFLESR